MLSPRLRLFVPSRQSVHVLALASLVVACGGGDTQGGSTGQGSQAAAPASEAAAPANPVDPATAGRISGTIRFDGRAPAPQPIKMGSDPNCMPASGAAGDAGTPAVVETVMVGTGGGLENVFVYVKDGLKKADGSSLQFPTPTTAVVLDQRGCRYTPHVFGIQVGQPLQIVNSDMTLHNVHALPQTNREFNTGQPNQGMRATYTFTAAEVMVPFRCDVHKWMNAWVGVLDHPFFTVSGADGAFHIDGLPPGTYTIEAWHEKLGTQVQTVTVAAKGDVPLSFTFKG